MMGKNIYKLRAHHGLCLCFFKGQGYSSEFVENMANIKCKLEENPLVCITNQTDVICNNCPNNIDGKCETDKKVFEYDRQVLERCHISEGESMPYLDFQRLIQHNILLLGKRKEICENCEWESLCND